MFAEQGFFQSTISMIAKEAGVADGTIYLYFKNKEDIIVQIFSYKAKLAFDRFREEVDKGTIHPVDPRHLIVNLLAMCIFPFVASPIISTLIFEKESAKFTQFLSERKKTIPEFIINSIKKNE